MKTILSAFLIFKTVALSHATDDFERDIEKLASGTPSKQIATALKRIESAEVDAFPVLIKHLSDNRLAEMNYFIRERGDVNADGSVKLNPDGTLFIHNPTIGDACFDILQGEIEGNWPKGFRQYYVLTPSNVKQWFAVHRGLTLAQLHRISLTESLMRAEKDLGKQPSDAFLKKAVLFLREELGSVKP